MKREIIRIQQRLERIENEISNLKATINSYFTEEEQTILRYEASIGKNGSRLEELGGTELEQYAAECKKYLRFGQEVDACLAEKLEQTSAVWVGTVPEVLQQNGCGNMDLYITQKHLRNILQASLQNRSHYHNIELQQLKQLPELLNNPLAILQSKSHLGSVIVVLDAKDRQNNLLIVPIRTDGYAFYQRKHVEANFILSVYGKRNVEAYIERSFVENGVLYLDKNKSIGLGRKSLQLRQFLNTNASINNVQQTQKNVNDLNDISPEMSKERKTVSHEKSRENEIIRKGI